MLNTSKLTIKSNEMQNNKSKDIKSEIENQENILNSNDDTILTNNKFINTTKNNNSDLSSLEKSDSNLKKKKMKISLNLNCTNFKNKRLLTSPTKKIKEETIKAIKIEDLEKKRINEKLENKIIVRNNSERRRNTSGVNNILTIKNIDINIIETRDDNEYNKNNNYSKITQRSTEEESMKKIQPMCIICNRLYPHRDIIYSKSCKHIFCVNCIKQYFIGLILKGENDLFNFKCPVPNCEGKYNKNIVVENIPVNYINCLNPNKNSMKFSLKKIKELNNNNLDFILEEYSKKNVLNINSNENFFLYSKNKDNICPKCNKNSLFYKKGNNFKVCLLCRKRFCKFCNNDYNDFHLVKNFPNHCKIYFKIDKQFYHNQNNGFFFNFLINFLYVFFAFFILFFGFGKFCDRKFKNCFFKNENFILNNNELYLFFIFKIILYIILMIICYFFLLAFIILIIPYFPLITLLDI